MPGGDDSGPLFSTAWNVKNPDRARWFDPVLVRDNPLFVDPFLLDFAREPEFEGASTELYEHFRVPFTMLAEDPKARTTDLLYFPGDAGDMSRLLRNGNTWRGVR